MKRFHRERYVGYWCGRIGLAAKGEIEERVRPLGLTAPEALLLGVLTERGSATLVELARLVKHAHPSVLSHLDTLEQKNLVERCPHPTDRRSKMIELTGAGRKLMPRLHTAIHAVNARALRGLDSGERAQLFHLLRRVAANLGIEQAPADGDGGGFHG